jgi:hypothetical protein
MHRVLTTALENWVFLLGRLGRDDMLRPDPPTDPTLLAQDGFTGGLVHQARDRDGSAMVTDQGLPVFELHVSKF